MLFSYMYALMYIHVYTIHYRMSYVSLIYSQLTNQGLTEEDIYAMIETVSSGDTEETYMKFYKKWVKLITLGCLYYGCGFCVDN